MRHASLFSGIGGFDLAAEWAGWENVFHCEWNPFGQRVLKHHFPNSISYNDITKTNFSIHEGTVDILTGGFPCQPYSTAGLRKGKEDERHLWPHMLRAIKEIKPSWVVGENVRGLVNWGGGLVFHEVQADLEAEGYEVLPFLLPACAVNAPHRRDRIWFVAYSDSSRVHEQYITSESNQTKQYCGTPFERRDFSSFPTQPPICGGNDGISKELDGITFSKWRNESIKAYGNAIVPQVAFEIFKSINKYQHEKRNKRP
jgi:DNA (cytosine-5)-methyltransferase 1